jgi:23S rRNA (adenine2503-C2)-methyltransferase
MRTYKIPTGYLFTDTYSKGELETLSIGDYGKSKNIKASFLGFNNDINGVPNGECIPLSEKWVITLSTQYGCAMKCTFCDVPKVQWNGNVSFSDLYKQFKSAIKLFPEVKYTDRLNIHFARMGEPIFNSAVYDFANYIYINKNKIYKETELRIETIHPVLTTSMPKFKLLNKRLHEWCSIKNYLYNGQAGLQLSINSTNDFIRNKMFNNMSLPLDEVSNICRGLPDPIGRKYCLNFALADGFEVDAVKLSRLFDHNKFMCKITPIHNNTSCEENNICTSNGYTSFEPYKLLEKELILNGFDVIIFVPSMDEEDGLVTCGNAVLANSKSPKLV